MKKKISKKEATAQIVMMVVGLFFAFRFRFIFKKDASIDDILFPFLGAFLVWLSFFLIRNRLVIEFDNNYLYLTRGKKSIVLPLSQVTALKATVSGNKWRQEFIIEYSDMDAKVFSLHFTPNNDGSLEEFVEVVRKQNPRFDYQSSLF
jgi:hypothetical protein